MPGIDGYTKLMLHMNGTDGSPTFTDSSDFAHSGTVYGDAQIDTAQSVFGGASGLFDGSGDYLDIDDSTDWDFGSGDWTIDFRVRFNDAGGNQGFMGRDSGTSSFYLAKEGSSLRYRDSGGSGGNVSLAWTVEADRWYHIAYVKHSGTLTIYVDGTSIGSGASDTLLDRSVPLFIGKSFTSAYYLNGWLDEVRISKGIARWTSNFTPPPFEYNNYDEELNGNIEISDSITVQDTKPLSNENIEIADSISVSYANTDAKYATKIISVNPLMFVTDTNPVEVCIIDATEPSVPTWYVITISGISNAYDFDINVANDYLYIGGNNGKVIKINVNNLHDKTVINLNDTDDVLYIDTNQNLGLTYASTDSLTGETYVIDERSSFKLDSDFQAVSVQDFTIDSEFAIVSAFEIDSEFIALAYQYFNIASDFKCLTKEVTPIENVDDIIPINLEDFEVYIDGNQLEDTDLILDSIVITHSIGEESVASFDLSRKHDQLNTTLEGVSSEITNQNTVVIKIKGTTEFSGKISELDCQYQNDTEFITVTALATEKENKFDTIEMSLPGLNSRLSLYDILLQNPKIYNPYVDPNNEDNPKKYKGIRVDLGTKITQSVSKWTIFDSAGSIATAIREGTFNPYQNWTYFWSPTVTKVGETSLGDISAIRFLYIGTSLAPVAEDLWRLDNAYHWRQREYDDIEEELGYYEVGEAPFKEINCRNGVLIAKSKWVDETNGLYSVTDASYNFIEYTKKVADLEYENLKNINGDILPETSCNFTLTVDAYLYYGISLLTRINIDNTTQSNIYKNANGFPVSVKSITITSSDRKVVLDADNLKSEVELETINSQFPDEDDEEYNEEEKRVLIALKTDMRTRLEVQ